MRSLAPDDQSGPTVFGSRGVLQMLTQHPKTVQQQFKASP
jgi:hypothetical protein